VKPLTLPWSGRDVPHAILDINRGCDIRCRACYNARPPENKTRAQIESDLDCLQRLRRLHTITIAGGEPLLHPDLEEIIRNVRSRGLRAALATNGRGLDAARAASLADAGLDLALLHIDPGQSRSELADSSSKAAVRDLRVEKLALLAGQGIAGGLLSTVYANDLENVAETIQLLIDVPSARYLVFTGHADFPRLGAVTGSMETGLRAAVIGGSGIARQMTNDVCARFMTERFRARPFALLPSRGTTRYDAWLSYQAVVAYDVSSPVDKAFLSSSLVERLGLRVMRAKYGRHSFFHDESPRAQRIQLALNAISGGHLPRNMRMLRHAVAGRELVSKHIVFQQAPTPDSSGSLTICGDCPDAVVVDGSLLPVCLADRVAVLNQGDFL
jgi:hypothetical protein